MAVPIYAVYKMIWPILKCGTNAETKETAETVPETTAIRHQNWEEFSQ